MSIAEILTRLDSVTAESILTWTEHDLIHTVALGHPDSDIAFIAKKLDADMAVSSQNNDSKLAMFRANFRETLVSEKHTLDDSLFDVITESPDEEERKRAFLLYENQGYPENIHVIQELVEHVSPDLASTQAKEYGFESVDAVRKFIEDYYVAVSPKYQTEYEKINKGHPIAHWNRNYLFKQAKTVESRPLVTFTVTKALDAFCLLWKHLGMKHISWYERTMWNQPMYVFNFVTPQGATGAILGNVFSNTQSRGIATTTAQQLSYVSLPFTRGDLNSSQVQRLFHELGHGVHHASRQTNVSPQWLEVPSTLMERFLLNSDLARSIGLDGLDLKPPSAHAAVTDICYSMFCLDLFEKRCVSNMSEYYDTYFPGYTRDECELHTECNLRQIVTYQSAYYVYILADAAVEKMCQMYETDFEKFVSGLWKFLVASEIPN